MSSPLLVFSVIATTAVVALACVRRIPEGQAYTLRRIGGHLRTIGAGTHLVLPLLERVAHKIRLLGNVIDIGRLQPAHSGCSYGGQVFFQVLDAERADAVIDTIADQLRERLPALLAGAADEDQAARNQRLKADLNRLLRERGILITRVQVALI